MTCDHINDLNTLLINDKCWQMCPFDLSMALSVDAKAQEEDWDNKRLSFLDPCGRVLSMLFGKKSIVKDWGGGRSFKMRMQETSERKCRDGESESVSRMGREREREGGESTIKSDQVE